MEAITRVQDSVLLTVLVLSYFSDSVTTGKQCTLQLLEADGRKGSCRLLGIYFIEHISVPRTPPVSSYSILTSVL